MRCGIGFQPVGTALGDRAQDVEHKTSGTACLGTEHKTSFGLGCGQNPSTTGTADCTANAGACATTVIAVPFVAFGTQCTQPGVPCGGYNGLQQIECQGVINPVDPDLCTTVHCSLLFRRCFLQSKRLSAKCKWGRFDKLHMYWAGWWRGTRIAYDVQNAK